MANKGAEPTFFPYVVKKTDYVSKLAYRYGFDAQEVWDHKKNQSTKLSRKDPDVLYSSDLLYFPRREQKPVPFKAGQANQYTLTPPKIEIHVCFHDSDGPLKNEPYHITNLGTDIEGTTGPKGEISVSVPVLTESIVVFFDRLVYEEVIEVGRLDPINTLSGIAQRLDALGFYDTELDDPARQALALAIVRFQESKKLEPTGRLDLDTVKKILLAFGR